MSVLDCVVDRKDILRNGHGERHESHDGTVRLNLGSGPHPIEGFENLDIENGQAVYPLDYPDNSVDEILASHILEHFSHRDTSSVLRNWVDKLRPGGRLRISVPDFEKLAELYQAGNPVDLQGYLLGGHKDKHDFHGCLFDRESLSEAMAQCGLERITRFPGNEYSCSTRLGISLNIQGFKPSHVARQLSNVKAVMSAPRFGPTLHFRCHNDAFIRLGIDCKTYQSCFWSQQICVGMETALKTGCKYILTLDFDTVFSPSDVLELYRLMEAFPEADAIFPLQSKRNCMEALFSICDDKGNRKLSVNQADLNRQILRAATGHFGLTMLRAESLDKFKRPWMFGIPNDAGLWSNGHTDPDIVFWKQWHAQDLTAYLAPRVVVGHIEPIIMWPDNQLKPFFQTQSDYESNGLPAEVAR